MTNLRSPTSLFNELGLSTHAAQVFNHLLTHPDASAIEIARTLSTHKQLIYQALKELEGRRLIHPYTHNRTRRYQLLNADQLMEDGTQRTSQIVLIQNGALARQQRNLFEKLWKQSI